MGHQCSLIHFTALSGLTALFVKDPKRLLKTDSTGVLPGIRGRKAAVKLLPTLWALDYKISKGSWVPSNHTCQHRPGSHFLLPILSVMGPKREERKPHSPSNIHVSLRLTSLASPHTLLRVTDFLSHLFLLCPITKHYQCLKVPDNTQ